MPLQRRASVSLTAACDNACVFCAASSPSQAPETPLADVRRLLDAARTDHTQVTFVGGEPANASTLLEAVRAARQLRFSAIGIQTHGGRLADRAFAEALVGEGLTDVALSLHGPTPSAHEHHTERAGSFAEVLAAARNAADAGATVVMTTVVTRSSYRAASAILPVLRTAGATAWLLQMVRVAGRAGASFDRVVPRLALAVPFALHALDVATRAGIATFVAGMPSCLLGPFAERRIAERPARAFADVCERCPARPTCAGVDPSYLERFGAAELHTRELTTSAASDAPAALGVGIGPLATVQPRPTFEPGARLRVIRDS